MEQLQLLPKIFEFGEDERWHMTFSDLAKIRLSTEDQVVMLKRTDPGMFGSFNPPVYPLDDDIYVKTWLTNPKSVTRWAGFDYWGEEPVGTSIRFRLSSDGTTQKFWNGTAWATAVAGQWNTVQEIVDHIETFPVTAKAIQVVACLKTTDSSKTPVLRGIGVLYEAFIDPYYDFNYDTVIPYLASLRPAKDWTLRMLEDSDTLDLVPDTDYSVEPFNIQDVVSVFNETDDPDHTTNLKASFNVNTKRLVLTESLDAGVEVWLRFSYKPEVAIMTNLDYGVVEKVPAIVVENADSQFGQPLPEGIAFRNRTAKTAIIIKSPFRQKLRYTLRIIATRGRDVSALMTALLKKVGQEPLMVSPGTDEQLPVEIQKPLADYGVPGLSDVQNKRVVLEFSNVNYWTEGERSANLVTSGLTATGDLDFLSGTMQRP
jgi:hypothetical protein